MLAVAVDLHHPLVAAVAGEDETGLYGAADSKIEGGSDYMGACLRRRLGGRVSRSVVDHDKVPVGQRSVDLFDHLADRTGLVVGRDHD